MIVLVYSCELMFGFSFFPIRGKISGNYVYPGGWGLVRGEGEICERSPNFSCRERKAADSSPCIGGGEGESPG